MKAPVQAQVQNASQVGCGVDFTVWLCKGQLYSAGNPQYGQLGHGTDHEYNAKDCEAPTYEVQLHIVAFIIAMPFNHLLRSTYHPWAISFFAKSRPLIACQQSELPRIKRLHLFAASVKLMYQPQPMPSQIKAFKETSVRAFACGHNHVVALDAERGAWSWGEIYPISSLLIFSCLSMMDPLSRSQNPAQHQWQSIQASW